MDKFDEDFLIPQDDEQPIEPESEKDSSQNEYEYNVGR